MNRLGFDTRASFLAVATIAATALSAMPASAQPAAATTAAPAVTVAPPASAPAVAPPAAIPPGQMLMIAPRKLEWEKGEPIPPGYHPSTEILEGLVIAGGVTLGVTWLFGGVLPGIVGIAACDAASSAGSDIGCAPVFGVLLIPAIGPFIAMPLSAAAFGGVTGAGIAVFTLDGLAQSAGAAMLIAGLVVQDDVLLRDDVVGGTHIKWKPTPMALGQSGHGFGVVGSF